MGPVDKVYQSQIRLRRHKAPGVINCHQSLLHQTVPASVSIADGDNRLLQPPWLAGTVLTINHTRYSSEPARKSSAFYKFPLAVK